MSNRLVQRGLLVVGYAIGVLICEPQLRLGRRRHDGTCDHCGKPLGRYSMEKLDFPDSSAEASSTIEKLRAMSNAEYVRICLECPEEPPSEQEAGST